MSSPQNNPTLRAAFLRSRSWLVRSGCAGLCLLASCSADERSLSFEFGRVGTAAGGGRGLDEQMAGGDGVGKPSEGGEAAGGTDDAAGGGGAVSGRGGQSGSPSGTGGSSSGNSGVPGGGVPGGGVPGGGAPGGGTPSGGAGGSSVTAGAGGEPFVSPCGDLNQNRVDDCEETVAQNSRFDAVANSWTADVISQQQWAATDARGQANSGSLLVLNTNVVTGGTGNTTLGSGQCLAAWGNQVFEFGVRVLMKSGQGGGRAAINVLSYGQDGCSGAVLAGQTPASTSETGTWQVLKGSAKIAPATRSMWVRLVATKPFEQASLEVLFDDVLVREK